MAPLLRALLLATFFAIAHAQTSASPPPPAEPAWTTVTNTSDLTIQQVAQFDLRIYALSTGLLKLGFVGVVSGQTQPFNGGFNYMLVITVSNGPPKNDRNYNASSWGIVGTMNWKLWSFKLM